MISAKCPMCHEVFSVRDQYAGRTVQCHNCGTPTLVPAAFVPEVLPVETAPAPNHFTIGMKHTAGAIATGCGCLLVVFVLWLTIPLVGLSLLSFAPLKHSKQKAPTQYERRNDR
jgi:hypothetical protein